MSLYVTVIGELFPHFSDFYSDASMCVLQALDGFLMTLDHMGTVLFVSDDSGDYVGLTPVSNHCLIIGHYSVSSHCLIIRKSLLLDY